MKNKELYHYGKLDFPSPLTPPLSLHTHNTHTPSTHIHTSALNTQHTHSHYTPPVHTSQNSVYNIIDFVLFLKSWCFVLRHDLENLSRKKRCRTWFGLERSSIEDLAFNRLR